MKTAETWKAFVRCKNSFDIPESLCTICFHTIVARDPEALQRAEEAHLLAHTVLRRMPTVVR